MEAPILQRILPYRNKKFSVVLPAAIFLGSAALRLWNLGAQSLWYDETYTAFVAQEPPDLMMRFLIADGVHPPLYYWIMAVWIRIFGNTAWVLRFPSAVGGVLSVVMLYLLVQKAVGKNEAALAAILLGLSPFFVWYSQDARMYSIDCLAAIMAVFFFREFLQTRSLKNLLAMTFSHAILYGLHYFGFLMLLTEACFLCLFRRKYGDRFLLFLLAQAVASLPLAWWMVLLLQRTNGSFGIGWIPQPTWMDPIKTIINFFLANAGGWSVSAAIGAVVLGVLLCASLWGNNEKELVSFGVLWLGLPILFVWILSQIVPVYIDRYLIFTLPAAILLVPVGANKIPGVMKLILPGILVLLMIVNVWNMNLPTETFHKEEWRQAAEYIRQEYRPDDLIVVRVYEEAFPFKYYGVLNLRWFSLEKNQQVTTPTIPIPAGKCFLVYWLPARSAHNFGAELPTDDSEMNTAVQDWITQNIRGVRSYRIFRGIFIIVFRIDE